MSQQQPATVSASPDDTASSGIFETPAYCNAIDRLSLAFEQRKPVVAVLAAGQCAQRYVTGRFLDRFGANATLIHVAEPCKNVIDLMRRIIRSIGFEPRELGVADLDKVFHLFLSFQKSHGQRTILWIECTGDNNIWVLDKIRSLIEMEQRGGYGLLSVLTGGPALSKLLATDPLNKIQPGPGWRIAVPPLTRDETFEYVRRRIETAGKGSVEKLFDHVSLTRLHELAEGVPDLVVALTSRSQELAAAVGAATVLPDHVEQACASLPISAATVPANDDLPTLTPEDDGAAPGRLVVWLTDDDVRELPLGQARLLIGRSRLCDIRLDDPAVSRHHALVICDSDGAAMLVDLSSTNGTYVDGRAVTEHTLSPGETIVIGDCRMRYVLDEVRRAQCADTPSSPQNEIRLLQN